MQIAPHVTLPRFELLRAGRAIAALLRDPDDLPQVFTVLESLSGTAPHRMLRRFARTPAGARLLRERPDIVPTLRDRAALRALPEATLGRAYLAFLESEGISAEGLIDAAAQGGSGRVRPGPFEFLHQRMRDTHDLWHAATGYKGDVLGEAALLAFTLGQTWNAGVGLIVGAALFKGYGRGEGNATIVDGFRRGRAARWLPAQPWEELLALPLAEVRARLGLGAPAQYTPVRTADLRAAGMLH